jgi:hypothetical protein
MKAAILVLSDPLHGSEEALGRLFNALAATYEFKQRGDDVALLFQGAGTRWAGELIRDDHPAHALFALVRDKVAGASCGCADVFGAGEGVEACGLERLRDNAVPGTSGMASLRNLVAEGYSLITF